MPWPDIFFKARKLGPRPVAQPGQVAPEAAKSPAIEPESASKKSAAVEPTPATAATTTPPPASAENAPRTLPALHGVVLRPPARLPTPSAPPKTPIAPIKNIEQLMAEADPVRTLRQTGSVRLLKRLTPDPTVPKPVLPQQPGLASSPLAASQPLAGASSPWPQFAAKKRDDGAPNQPAEAVQEKAPEPEEIKPEVKLPEPAPSSLPPPFVNPVEAPKEPEPEMSFMLKPESPEDSISLPPTDRPPPASTPAPTTPTLGSIFRRKAKMADVARIVLPPKREETTRLPRPPAPESNATVLPPAFPVAAMTARPPSTSIESQEPTKTMIFPPTESPFLGRTETRETKPDPAPATEGPRVEAEAAKPVESSPATAPVADKPMEPMSLFPDPPKVDPEAHKTTPDVTAPKVDPEAHRPPPSPAPAMQSKELSPSSQAFPQEKREFHLTNGEKVAGVVLSESPDAIYVEHATLGVITVPRREIAKRLVEIILTNGDRIVGDIMAETADMLYVRHSALGMLSVPRAHRSTRVVEAILKDGDRILGEVLTETDTFTVIRSPTLGTVTVPHAKMAMLNRKIEQVEMKALPPAAPELKDKA